MLLLYDNYFLSSLKKSLILLKATTLLMTYSLNRSVKIKEKG